MTEVGQEAARFFTRDGRWVKDGPLRQAHCAVCGRIGGILATGGILSCRCGARDLVEKREQ